MKVTTVGIDLAKNVFQLHGVNDFGKTVIKKQLRRAQVAEFFVNLPPCLIGMEACGSAHHWARKLQGQLQLQFAYIELSAILVCLVYASSVAEIAKVVMSLFKAF